MILLNTPFILLYKLYQQFNRIIRSCTR